MQYKIFTTVGTSIITNDNNIGNFDDFNDESFYESWTSVEPDFLVQSRKWLPKIKQKTSQLNLSAEISSLLKIQEDLKKKHNAEDLSFEVYLLCTDTINCYISAWCVQKHLEEKSGFSIHDPIVVKGLQVKNRYKFETLGLVELFDCMEKHANGWYNCLIAMTGGYKAIIPFLTIIAQIYSVPLYYIFDDGTQNNYELLKMPQMPIDINWSEFEKYRDIWHDLRNGIDNWETYKLQHNIMDDFHECLLVAEDNYALISGIGEAFLRRYEQWTFVYILAGGPFSGKYQYKRQLNEAISKLQNSLNQFITANNLAESDVEQIVNRIRTNGGELDHTSLMHGTPCCISKFPSANPEIRMLYSFEVQNSKIARLKIWEFRIGEFNHSSYPQEFRNFYDANKDGNFIPYLQVQNSL